MAGTRLFGNHITPACKYCLRGYPGRGDSVLCGKYGVVPGEHKCRHFEYDPLRRIPKRPLPLEQYDKKEFALGEEFSLDEALDSIEEPVQQ